MYQKLEAAEQDLRRSLGLSGSEISILRNEHGSPKISWLSEDERWEKLKKIWSEVKLLTGCVLYQGEMINLQLSMLEKFLLCSPRFSELTTDEILHSFYLNNQCAFADSVPGGGDMFRHYNKELNAEFVGDVLNAYLKHKAKLYAGKRDAILRAINPPPEKPPVIITNDDWKQYIQWDYELYMMGETEWIKNSSPKYLFLRKCGLIFYSSRKKWSQFYQSALMVREQLARRPTAVRIGGRIARDHATRMYDAIRESGLINSDEHLHTIYQMRKMIYLKFFDTIAACAIKNIFTEIQSDL